MDPIDQARNKHLTSRSSANSRRLMVERPIMDGSWLVGWRLGCRSQESHGHMEVRATWNPMPKLRESLCNVVNFFLGLAMWFVIYTVLVSTLFVLIMVAVKE